MSDAYDYFPDGSMKNEFDYNEPLDNNGSYLFFYRDDQEDENDKT